MNILANEKLIHLIGTDYFEGDSSMKILIICVLFLGSINLAQIPSEPFHPMTANGARHIYAINNQSFSHILYWKNNSDVLYNEVYFSSDSALVANLNPSVKVLSGADSNIVYNSMPLSLIGTLNIHTKYYWRVVQFNSFGSTAGPVWHFISQGSGYNFWEDNFSSGLANYTIQPQGANWSISNTNNAGGTSPELIFYNEPSFNGTSYLILNNFFDMVPGLNPIRFTYSVDWVSGQFEIGMAYSLDEGFNWMPFWQQTISNDVTSNQLLIFEAPHENYVKIAFYCKSIIPNSSGYVSIDDLFMDTPLTVPQPPGRLTAKEDSLALRVSLNWTSGFSPFMTFGYRIQRKNGLPQSSGTYYTLVDLDPSILNYTDYTVKLDSIYTYRISGPGGSSWSNEATAYVPEVVPVELTSFSASVSGNNVTLNWSTASESNNYGFSIERSVISIPIDRERNLFWESVGFVSGNGTTTEAKSYYYKNENLHAGKYQYRLKQIDFDGSFEYSNIIEVELGLPTKFILEQNYPNPFNPSTTIKFSIPDVGTRLALSVQLKVYDFLGSEIVTLVSEEKPAGIYEVEFDASAFSSGLYIYKLTAGAFTDSKKMILMK